MSQSNPKKILVIKHGSLGDIVFALEPILAIQKKFNNAVIDLVTEEKFIPFFKKMNMFHQFLIDNRKDFFATLGLINKIIFGKYDLVIDLQNSKRTNLYHFFIKIFSKAKINGSRSNVHERYIIPPQGTESPTQGLLNQLQLLGIEEINPNFSWLENNHHDLDFNNKDVVMVIPGVSQSGKYKQWAPNKFQEICSFLEAKGFHICLVGTKHDIDAIKPILDNCTNIINLIDKSPPDVIYSVANKCKLIISNDTGPGHIASLSRVNTLWLALDNPITKANLSFRKNSHLVLKSSMEDLSVDEVKNFLSNNKLIDKV
tara:strand:- start:982 stop:1926 length:945 start_codon:yes stop_codon:yes gene_type:complete